MLAYAPTNRVAARAGSPRTLLFVIAGHAALLAVVITARTELPQAPPFIPTVIDFIDPPKPPPPPPPEPSKPRVDTPSRIDTPAIIIPIPQPPPPIDRGPPIRDTTPLIGTAVVPIPVPFDPPVPIIRKAARFITPTDDVRPPYPAAKRELEQEASLRLALQIDERGRVTSVDPVGAADPAFLDAARRHILRRWRYAPATEGGTAMTSRIVVTLRFELDD